MRLLNRKEQEHSKQIHAASGLEIFSEPYVMFHTGKWILEQTQLQESLNLWAIQLSLRRLLPFPCPVWVLEQTPASNKCRMGKNAATVSSATH